MTTVLIVFGLALVISVLSTRLMIALALRVGVVDRPDGYRRIHKTAIPRMGGPAIFLAFVAPLALVFLSPGITLLSHRLQAEGHQLWGLFACAFMILVLGLVDDVMGLRPRIKILWQVVIAIVAYTWGFSIHHISLPFGGSLHLGNYALPFTVFWFVACMNAINLVDGIDGLAAGTSLFVSLTLFLISLHAGNLTGMVLMAAMAGAVLGFLVFNFPPARIFLGDSGSLLLGFLIASLSLVGTTLKKETAVALLVPIVALGLPIIDTSLAILRRWYHRMPFSAPDRQHVHHMLVSMGYSPRRAVLSLYAASVVLGAAALLTTLKNNEVIVVVVVSLAAVAYASVRIIGGFRLSDIMVRFSTGQARREQSTQVRIEYMRTVSRFHDTQSLDRAWALCGPLFEVMQLDRVELRLLSGPGMPVPRVFAWSRPSPPPSMPDPQSGMPDSAFDTPPAASADAGDSWIGFLAIHAADRLNGSLYAEKVFAASSLIPEVPDLLSRLRDELAACMARISTPGPSA